MTDSITLPSSLDHDQELEVHLETYRDASNHDPRKYYRF